ncbi:NADPH:quinone reductase [Pararobbsia alpina]|jgi:NADPH:quinone reductase|uniref:NADPH:quinone oxidoreductase family protein n=1 Tax=Pararobbsia alpina TaxID=621374 RepID=UPI0039A78661
MKALMCHAFGPISDLKLEDVTDPTPEAGQVVIKVEAASINFPDALIVQGLYQFKPPLPFSPGAELAGTVHSVGEGVRHLKVGDRVIASTGHGGFAELCVADAMRVMPLPPGMDFELGAAFVLTYGTSFHALQHIAKLQAGETLLVLGAAGGVGLAAIEIAKAMGARVIAAASSADKLELCKQVGADETVNYEEDDWRKRVDALTDGKGVDVVYDAVGGKYSEPALRATAWRGRFLVVGFAAGEIPKLPLNLALLKERAILGVFWGDAVRRDPAQHIANMKQLGAWFNEGKVKPFISERIALSGAADGIARMASRKVKGKVVVLPGA